MQETRKESFNVATSFTDFMHQKEAIVFAKLPIPPSSNHQYFLAKRGNKTYHIPSDDLKKFKKSMSIYPAINGPFFNMNKTGVRRWIEDGLLLEVRVMFFFRYNRIFCKDGKPKKMDVSNRLKALHDQLSHILEIDDSWFFKIYAEKCVAVESLNEESYVEISPL
jgi:Holliday junction resolvase RusA-like endonuclease